MNHYKLFLDDERKPSQVKWVPMPLGPWVIVRDYATFVDYITKNGIPAFVSFDHDLADGTFKEKTGFHCAQWLVEYCLDKDLPFPEYQVHSMNPIGKENIRQYIESFNRNRS